jgi:hypothetical protein
VAADPHPDWLGGALTAPADHGPLEGFEVMYLVRASHRQATTLRMHLSDVGNSVVVVQGSGELWHVHVHLDHPAEALSELEMSQVCVRRLDSPRRAVGLVAATTAPQLLEPLAQAGAVAVLRANASTISRAVVDTGAADVIVLPCSSQAAEDAAVAKADPVVVSDGISVSVAPTHHDLAVYEAVGVLEAAGGWTPAEQLAAVRDLVAAETVHTVANGDMGAIEAEVHALATRLVALQPAVVSVLAGGTVGARRAARQLTALVRAANPAIETFIVVGGQPEPALVVSAQ